MRRPGKQLPSGHGVRRLLVEADGGSRGNPGNAGYGAVVMDAESGEVLAEVAERIGYATNNVAEYRGLIAGLQAAALVSPGAAAEVRMDSKLVVEQMSGRWKVKHPDLEPLARLAHEAASALGTVSYVWVPREQNRRADKLANDAMDGSERLPRDVANPGSDTTERRAPDGHRPRSAALAAEREPSGNAGPIAAPATTGWAARHHDQPTTTILLRHGQTPMSADRRFVGSRDIELTELGEAQARAAARRLAHREIGLILTSPLRRARKTAEEVARVTGSPVRVEPDLREADFGAWEGLTFAEAQEKWPAEMAAWLADAEVAPPGGECFADVDRRVSAALNRMLAKYAKKTLLVVSHVTPIKTLVRHALLAPSTALFRMHLDVATLCEIDWYADGPAVVRSLNDGAHLAGLS